MSIFDNWILQAILLDEALDSLRKFDEDDFDDESEDAVDILKCSDCSRWKRYEDSENSGKCIMRNETMFKWDFCSKALKKVEFTEEEKETARFLEKMGIINVNYDPKEDAFTLVDILGNIKCKTSKPLFPTLKNNIGKDCMLVLKEMGK